MLGTLVPGYTAEQITPVIHDPVRPMPARGPLGGPDHTPEKEVPVELRVLADRRVELRLDGESAISLAGASQAWDVQATFPVQLPTADARINSPVLGLALRLEGEG